MPFCPLHRCMCPLGPSAPSQTLTMGTPIAGMTRWQGSPLSPVGSKSQHVDAGENHAGLGFGKYTENCPCHLLCHVSVLLQTVTYNKENNTALFLFTVVFCIVLLKTGLLTEIKLLERLPSDSCSHSDDFIFLRFIQW